MVDAIAKRRIIEEDLYECGLDVHHYLFFCLCVNPQIDQDY